MTGRMVGKSLACDEGYGCVRPPAQKQIKLLDRYKRGTQRECVCLKPYEAVEFCARLENLSRLQEFCLLCWLAPELYEIGQSAHKFPSLPLLKMFLERGEEEERKGN